MWRTIVAGTRASSNHAATASRKQRGRHGRSALQLVLGALLVIAGAVLPVARSAHIARACAFDDAPTTYETTEDRKLYMKAMDLAGYDMLFANDPFFSQPSIESGTRSNRVSNDDVYVPPTLLKAISWIESRTSQGAPTTGFGSTGPALVAFDCGYGIAQVTSGMTAPIGESGQPTDQQALVASHFAYNIGRGAAILIDKWNNAPESRPIVGIDTDSNPHIVENWYYAVWGYNGFTGPGANRSNHPLDPVYGTWPRTPYSCANDNLGHNRSMYPYQELVFGCMAHPPSVQGQLLFPAVPVTLPDLSNPYWRTPLDLKNFQFPYTNMDLPTPKPLHLDPTPRPSLVDRIAELGLPQIAVDRPIVLVNFRPGESSTPAEVRISNVGTGIQAWRASANRPWVRFSQDAGVALGPDVPCTPNATCDRTAVLKISVDTSQLVGSDTAVVHIAGLGGFGGADIAVFLRANVAIGIPGTTKN